MLYEPTAKSLPTVNRQAENANGSVFKKGFGCTSLSIVLHLMSGRDQCSS